MVDSQIPRIEAADDGGRRGLPLADRVYAALQRQIIEGAVPPESILYEGVLARQYGVSKAPVRVALKRLDLLGLVRSVPRVGYIVTSVGIDDLDEIFAMRLALEPLAAGLAATQATDEELDELELLAYEPLELARRPIETRAAALARSNTAFHQSVARLSGSRRLERSIRGLADELERVVHMLGRNAMLEEVTHQHSELLRVLRLRDPDEANQTMRRQLETDRDVLTRVLASWPSGATMRLPAAASQLSS
jgi:DNA-binding GntR family transcriptional regulator